MGRDTLRAVEVWPQADRRSQQGELLRAALRVVGEQGYADASVRAVLERSGASRDRFYRHFDSLDECFAAAFEAEAERLWVAVSEAAAAEAQWRSALTAALGCLLDEVARDPVASKAIFVEARAAGPALESIRGAFFRRATHALATARLEPDFRQHVNPAAELLLAAGIEEAVRGAVASGRADEAPALLPGLRHLVLLSYFGERVAWREGSAASGHAGLQLAPS